MSDCGGGYVIWELQNESYYNPEPYTGSVCRSSLLVWQDCALGPTNSENIVIGVIQDQTVTEQLLSDVIQAIG